MNSSIFYYIYSIFAFVYFVWFLIKAQKKNSSGLIAFWILSFPILNRDEFMIHTSFGFDLHPTRIFLIAGMLFLSITRIADLINHREVEPNHKLVTYEYFILAYAVFSSVVIIIKAPDFRDMVPLVSEQLVFVVMYFIARDHLPNQDKAKLVSLLILFGILSSIVSIIQFYYNPDFFRLSSKRIAYGTLSRANGFLLDEFENGLFLTCLSGYVLIQRKSNIYKFILISIFALGVFLTMHRASWLIFCITLLFYSFYILKNLDKKMFVKIFFLVTILLICVLIISLIYLNTSARFDVSQDFIENQLQRDTLQIRLELAKFGIDIIKQNPDGIGDFSFKSYGQLYYNYGLGLHYGKPLIVHNGFIAATVKFGVLGGLFFLLFIVFACIFFWQKRNIFGSKSISIIIILLSYSVINITQDMSSLGSFSVLIIAFLVGNVRTFNFQQKNNEKD